MFPLTAARKRARRVIGRSQPVEADRRRTMRFPTETCTGSSFWFNVVVFTLMTPCSVRDLEGRTSSTSILGGVFVDA